MTTLTTNASLQPRPGFATGTPLLQKAAEILDDLRNQVTEHPRITDDEQGVLAALTFALRADCTRRRVGAVGVDIHGRVIGTGRNGVVAGRPGCMTAGGCPRGAMSKTEVPPGSSYSTGKGCCEALHAEENCSLFTDPLARRGGTMFISDAPCDDCSRRTAGAGWARLVWPERAPDGTWMVRSRLIGPEHPLGGLYD